MAKGKTEKKKSAKKEEVKTISIRLEWVLGVFLTILLITSLFTKGFSQLPYNIRLPFIEGIKGASTLNEDEIKQRVTQYINEEILQGQIEAEITEVVEDEKDKGLYKIKINIGGQEYESFVSKDGKYFYIERQEIVLVDEIESYPKQDVPEVLVFTMSYCPFGNQAEDLVEPVYDLLANTANIQPHYVIYNESHGYQGEEYCLDDENKYCSMHGVGELNQGIRELCTFKYQNDKFWNFVMAANEKCDAQNVDSCWEGIAKEVGMDTDQVKGCQANEAFALLEEEVKLNEQYSVTGSPTIIINGKIYEGERNPEAFKQAICASYTNQPQECSQTLESSGTSSEGSCN